MVEDVIASEDDERTGWVVPELAVAYAVDPEHVVEVAAVVALVRPSDDVNPPLKRNRLFVLGSVGCIIILVIVIALSIYRSNGKSQTIPPGRIGAIYRKLRYISGPAVYNETSPQGKSAHWIAYEDKRELQATDSQLVQRYVLALLYISTNGNEWTNCSRNESSAICTYICYQDSEPKTCNASRYLSDAHECQWMGSYCLREEGEIRELFLCKSN